MSREQNIGYGTAASFRKVTECELGTTVPDSTFNAWISLSRTMRIADDTIDSESDEQVRKAIYDSAINMLSDHTSALSVDGDRLATEMRSLRSHLATLSEDQRASFIGSLKNLLRITEMLKMIDDPAKLARYTMLEGQVTSRLYTSFLPECYARLDGYGKYLKYTTRLSRAVNALDTLVDFPRDYAEGNTRVMPTPGNVAVFAAQTVRNTVFVATHTGRELLTSFVNGAVVVARDRSGNSPIHF